MKLFSNLLRLLLINIFVVTHTKAISLEQCLHLDRFNYLVDILSQVMIPDIDGLKKEGPAGKYYVLRESTDYEMKKKGEAGKIVVIGGSTEYSGAPYFAAISALKVGADLVHVITTKDAAPVIKSYSPDLIVHPIRDVHSLSKIGALLPKTHVVVLGPGIGRENDDMKLVCEIIEICRKLKKPLVIDGDGLYALSKNISVLKDYPSPGAILTPNHAEAKRLKDAVPTSNDNWMEYWGKYVSVLEKGKEDKFHTELGILHWSRAEGGSARRVGGQGDILAGLLGTFYHWAIEANICETSVSDRVAQGTAAYAAAKLTRTCNAMAYSKHGRSMTTSDMINEIHSSFTKLFW